jgi:hypothetical protein
MPSCPKGSYRSWCHWHDELLYWFDELLCRLPNLCTATWCITFTLYVMSSDLIYAEFFILKSLKNQYKNVFQYSVCINSVLFFPGVVTIKEKSFEALLDHGGTYRCYSVKFIEGQVCFGAFPLLRKLSWL